MTVGTMADIKDSAFQRTDFLARAMQQSGISLTVQDSGLRYLHAENLPPSFRHLDLAQASDVELFGPTDGARISAIKRGVLLTGERGVTHIEHSAPGAFAAFELTMERAGPTRGDGVLTIIRDVTEHRLREKVMGNLLREMSHRSKNLLAIMQSVTSQTARHAGSVESFVTTFEGRLQSLARSQDIITEAHWRGVHLFELADCQILPYWPEDRLPPELSGDDIFLDPQAAIHIGLALHELISAAVARADLARPGRRISLSCKRSSGPHGTTAEIIWLDLLGDAGRVKSGVEPNFAPMVLRRIVPWAVGGIGELTETTSLIRYSLIMPLPAT